MLLQRPKFSFNLLLLKRFMSNLHEMVTVDDVVQNYIGLLRASKNRRLKFDKIGVEQMKDSVVFCESLGFTKDDLKKHPELLKKHVTTLDNQYTALKESGFVDVKPEILARFRSVTNDSIKKLKKKEILPANINVVENLISHLNPSPENLKVADLTEEESWAHIHNQIIKRYLMWRLDASKDEIEQLFRVYKMITLKSLKYLCENIAIAEDLNFKPIRKLLKYGYLLHMYPQYSKTVLETMPNLAGSDLKMYMRRYPKLAMVSPRNYVEIYKMLKQANIDDETIRHAMNIFHCSPKTVRTRLNDILNIPEFKIHLHNPRVLRLIVHYNRAKYRLTFLQAVKLKCSSMNIIATDGDLFDKHVREGADVNVKSEVIRLVQHLLKSNSEDILTNLKKHPYYRNVPLLQIQDTHKYLSSCEFKNDAIMKAVQILLYPRVKIEKALGKINKDPSLGKIKTHQKLNLALYFMEKEYHFTGNGITDTIL